MFLNAREDGPAEDLTRCAQTLRGAHVVLIIALLSRKLVVARVRVQDMYLQARVGVSLCVLRVWPLHVEVCLFSVACVWWL